MLWKFPVWIIKFALLASQYWRFFSLSQFRQFIDDPLSIPTKLAQTSISKPTLLSLNTKLILLKDTTQILEFCYQLLSYIIKMLLGRRLPTNPCLSEHKQSKYLIYISACSNLTLHIKRPLSCHFEREQGSTLFHFRIFIDVSTKYRI